MKLVESSIRFPVTVVVGVLLAVLFGTPGDSPKVVLAASSIEECFHFVITARKLAEEFRTPVILLSDANLATGMQPPRFQHTPTLELLIRPLPLASGGKIRRWWVVCGGGA